MGNMPPHMSPGMPPHMSPGTMLPPGMATMPPPGMMNMMEMPSQMMQQNPHAMQMPMPGMHQGWDHWRAMQGHPQMPHVIDAHFAPSCPAYPHPRLARPVLTRSLCVCTVRKQHGWGASDAAHASDGTARRDGINAAVASPLNSWFDARDCRKPHAAAGPARCNGRNAGPDCSTARAASGSQQPAGSPGCQTASGNRSKCCGSCRTRRA